MLVLQTGCEGIDYEQQEVAEIVYINEPAKGVVTTIQEVEPNRFVVVNEQVISKRAASEIVVKYLNGATAYYSLDEAKKLIKPADQRAATDTTLRQHLHQPTASLGYLIMGSLSGYLLGKDMAYPLNPNVYNSFVPNALYQDLQASVKPRAYRKTTYMTVASRRAGFFERTSNFFDDIDFGDGFRRGRGGRSSRGG